jgi:WD40 repeat protein
LSIALQLSQIVRQRSHTPAKIGLQGHTNWIWSIAFSSDSQILASGSDDKTVKLWDVHTGRCLNTLKEEGYRVRSLAFSPDGKILATGSDDQSVSLWSVPEGKRLKSLQGYTQRVWSVAFSPDGQTLVSGRHAHRRFYLLVSSRTVPRVKYWERASLRILPVCF